MFFVVNLILGVIYIVRFLDREEKVWYNLIVRVIDGGVLGWEKFVYVFVFVMIVDVNDNVLVVIKVVLVYVIKIFENVLVGSLLVRVIVFDVDIGENVWLSFGIVKNFLWNGMFIMNVIMGEVVLNSFL